MDILFTMLIGITGGVATGKSAVSALFRRRGAAVFSADEAARAALQPGAEAFRQVLETFGPAVVKADGTIDRAKLGAIVFADPEARRTLESITHPPILRLLREQIDAARAASPDGLIAVEVPLLYESGMQDWFDRVLVVAAAEPVQVARLMGRSGLSEAEARRMIASQMPLAEKIARADLVIWNDGTPAELEREVERAWAILTTDDGPRTADR